MQLTGQVLPSFFSLEVGWNQNVAVSHFQAQK